MRRFLAITFAAAIAAAGCGDDASNSARQAGQQPQEAAGEAAAQTNAEGLATATKRLANEIARAARELANNPKADVDDRLRDAERRANDLSDQAQNRADEQQPELASALQKANAWLAQAAAHLRDADSADDVQQVLERELGPAGDRLADAAKQVGGSDTQRRLEQARDQIQNLRDELPDISG